MVNLAPNATRILGRWGDTSQKMRRIDCQLSVCNFIDRNNQIIASQQLPQEDGGFPNFYVHRSHTQVLIYEYALSIGVEFRFGQRISEYWETDDEAGIVVNGARVSADCVIAADGVHSNARKFVTGLVDTPEASGFAIFRSYFPIDSLLKDDKIKYLIPDEGDSLNIWIGENAHGILQTNKQLGGVTVFLTHKVRSLRSHVLTRFEGLKKGRGEHTRLTRRTSLPCVIRTHIRSKSRGRSAATRKS
jgi:hypothetical protein